MKRKFYIKILLVLVLLLLIPQKVAYDSENTTILKIKRPNLSIMESTYNVMIERIYIVDEMEGNDQGYGDMYLDIIKDMTHLDYFGDQSAGNYKVRPNSFKQMNLDIYTSSVSGTASSINITVQAKEFDTGDDDELGIVEYIIPSLSEGEYHRYVGESADQNIKIWFLTTFGAEPLYEKFSSSFVIDQLEILDSTDSGDGEISLEVLFNGMPQNSQIYPTASPNEWLVESGITLNLDLNLTSDLITENHVPFSNVIIMVYDRDDTGFPFYYDFYTTLGYIEINMTTDFSFSNQEFTTVIPGSSGKAKLFITASMSRLPPSVEITSPTNTTYGFSNIQFNYNTDNYDAQSIWLDNSLDNTILSGSSRSLGEGTHNFTIKLSNTAATIVKSVLFTVDVTTTPVVTITSPINTTYASDSVTLTYSVSEQVSITVFLDGISKGNIPSGGTLDSLSDGSHNLTIEALDAAGLTGKATVWFTTDNTEPIIKIISPTDNTINPTKFIYTISESNCTIKVYINGIINANVGNNSNPFTLLEPGEYNFTIQVTDKSGKSSRDTVMITRDLLIVGSITSSDSTGKTEDEKMIYWLYSIPLVDIGSLTFNYSIEAKLNYVPIYGIQPGDNIVITSEIIKDSCFLTLISTNLEDPLIELGFDQTLASFLSDLLEKSYPLPLDLSFGINRITIDETLDLFLDEYRIKITLDIIISSYMQLGVLGNAEFSGSDYISYSSYSTKFLNLKILESAENREVIVIKSGYGISINNIILDLEVTQISNQNQESARIIETGPFPSIWVSNDYLVNDIIIGKPESSPGFEIIAFIPFFMCIIILRRRKKHKTK